MVNVLANARRHKGTELARRCNVEFADVELEYEVVEPTRDRKVAWSRVAA